MLFAAVHESAIGTMPRDFAVIVAARCLPLSKGLHELRPVARPAWLKNVPEKCCKPSAPLETLARQLIKKNIGSSGMRPVSLRIPISNAVEEFGELSIDSFYVTNDFNPKPDFANDHNVMQTINGHEVLCSALHGVTTRRCYLV